MSNARHPDTARGWGSADAFYRERDDRTAREVGGLAGYALYPVEIRVDPAAAAADTTQRVALVAANLTARWARRVRVVTPAVPLVASLARAGWRTLAERIRGEMRAADPFGDFEVVPPEGERRDDGAALPLRLYVGAWAASVADGPCGDDFVVDASGWQALGRRARHGVPIDAARAARAARPASVAAAGLAGALGAADLFKRAVGHPVEAWLPTLAWCTWRHQLRTGTAARDEIAPAAPVPETLDLGHTLVAGVGAIGSALLYLVDLAPARGTVGLLDRDRVETSNLNRSPLFTAGDALAKAEKVSVGREYLGGRDLGVEVYRGTWRDCVDQVRAARFDTWVSFTNEDAAWAEIPFQLPPVVVHGTTTSGWGFGAGRHVPGRDDCTLCRMPRPAAEFRGRCAEGDVAPPTAPAPVRASLPFLSTAAAALVYAELAKRKHRDEAELPNDVAADLREGLPAVLAVTRRGTPGCRGCRAAALSKAA